MRCTSALSGSVVRERSHSLPQIQLDRNIADRPIFQEALGTQELKADA
ncbi:hypothetical protein QUA41_14215 [Microcoleus sp. Pol11C1]